MATSFQLFSQTSLVMMMRDLSIYGAQPIGDLYQIDVDMMKALHDALIEKLKAKKGRR